MYKRFEIRRKADFPVEVITNLWDEPIPLIADDFSPRGTYLISELMPNVGEHIICSFNLPKLGEHMYFGEVSRVNWLRRSTDKGRPGFGVEFLDISPLTRLKIREALKDLPPPLPMGRRDGVAITPIIRV